MKPHIPTFRARGAGFGLLLLGLVGLAFALVATLLVGLLLSPIRALLGRGRQRDRDLDRSAPGTQTPGPEPAGSDLSTPPLAGAVDVRYEEVS